jgi:hypothetical protein
MSWRCGGCDGLNEGRQRLCDNCGSPRPTGAPAGAAPLTACTGCGAGLDPQGWCRAGGGYSGHLGRQPTVCPACRRPVTWGGACYDCRAFPGDPYAWEKGHWVQAGRGPGRRATVEEAVAALMAIGLQLPAVTLTAGDAVPVGALVLQAVTGARPP